MYLTYDVPCYDDFEFDASKAKEVEYFNAKLYGINEPSDGDQNDGQNLCAKTKEKVPKGNHVLTIASPSTDYVYFSSVLIP